MSVDDSAPTSMQSVFADVFDDSKPSKTSLYHFMNRFALSALDTEAIPNFISMAPEYRRRFFVPDRDIPNMMKLLSVCMNEGIANHFYELQDSNGYVADNGDIVPGSSGLLFEFHFKTVHETIEFDTIVPTFIRVLFEDILSKHIEFPSNLEEKHYCFYLKTTPVYDESSLEYHATFRIVIPTIMVDSGTRFFIQRRVWRSKKLMDKFNLLLHYHLQKCLVTSMRTAPVSLMGSRHPDKLEPLQFKSAFPMRTIEGVSIADISAVDASKFTSLINDISVAHHSEGSSVVKRDYCMREASLAQMANEMDDKQKFSMAYDEAYSMYMQMLVEDDEIEHIHAMVGMLDDVRFETVDACIEIIRSLASEPDRYKCVAVMAIKDRNKLVRDFDGKKSPISLDEFNVYWNEAINGSSRERYAASAILYWAKCDSPSKVDRYITSTVRKLMIRDIRHPLTQGRIEHNHVANYLHFMFRITYVTQSVQRSPADWYEFVTPDTADLEPGQIYKWRNIGSQPDSLSIWLSREFKNIAASIYTDMKALCAQSDENQKPDARTKYIMDLSAQYLRTIRLIFNNGAKKAIIDEATALFKKNYFVKQLDRTPHILGVGNGVLEFTGSEVRLLDYYHTYPISLFTDTNYVPYDESSKFVKTIYSMLRSMVPSNEMDALEFLLYYFSTSLDWMPKESLFLIIHGGGSNGKSVLMELFRRTLGELYVRKMPLSFITEQNRNGSANADPAMMELRNARMVYYSESDRNEKVNVAKVKEITGGESLSGRNLFKGQENFSANCNHIVTTNHQFVIETTEHAVWRRFMSYKFKICFKVKCDPNEPNERPRDPELIDKIKADKRYQEAFLSILIHYRSKLYALYGGQILRVPHPTIKKETEEYRQSEDIYQRFIMNNLYKYDGGGDLAVDDLIVRFRAYYLQEGGGQYKGKSEGLLHIFRNSAIAGHIRLMTGKYILQGFYVPPNGEKAPEGAIVYHEWAKNAKANA